MSRYRILLAALKRERKKRKRSKKTMVQKEQRQSQPDVVALQFRMRPHECVPVSRPLHVQKRRSSVRGSHTCTRMRTSIQRKISALKQGVKPITSRSQRPAASESSWRIYGSIHPASFAREQQWTLLLAVKRRLNEIFVLVSHLVHL